MKNEIENGAKALGISIEEAQLKYTELCEQNGLESSSPIGVGLWRNYVANAKRTTTTDKSSDNDSLFKPAFGFFVSLEQPRDMMSWNRSKAKEHFLRDADDALSEGLVAVANENELGKFTISRYHNGEYREAIKDSLPDGAETLEDGRIFIPLDNIATYMNGGKNKNYGRPLPKEQMRRSGIFYGYLDGSTEAKPYFFSYKNQAGVDFTPPTFEWLHMQCIVGSNGTDIYGGTDTTLNSLRLNKDLDPSGDSYRNTAEYNFEDIITSSFEENIVPLVEIDRVHNDRMSLPAKERYILTDGTVCNMNMTPTKNGNRIINITDLNAELDYENDTGMVTCWIPEHLELDFGIGSSVIVVGRTSQRMVDGVVEPATINVSGVYCTHKHGSPVEVTQTVEEDFDWF